MKIEQLQKFFEDAKSNKIAFEGTCHDCSIPMVVSCDNKEGEITITGGAVYLAGQPEAIHLRCENCFKLNKELKDFQLVETYSRVVGYYRPVSNYHDGKKAEFGDRKMFNITEILKGE